MEGITGYIYRNAVREFYGCGIDRYFSPFVTFHQKRVLNNHECEDLRPDHNKGIELIPQILTNNAAEFLSISHYLKEEYGYGEVNLNLGCPSGTVASKGKGAGFLEHTPELERFLDEIFAHAETKISIKTRIGMNDNEVFPELIRIYSHLPMAELIIHPRIRRQMYNGVPDVDSFISALGCGSYPICYNGDIYSVADYDTLVTKVREKIIPENEGFQAVMCGRGMISHPYLLSELSAVRRNNKTDHDDHNACSGNNKKIDHDVCSSNSKKIDNDVCSGNNSKSSSNGTVDDMHDIRRLRAFHDRIVSDYMECYNGDDGLVLRKMKEIWTYMIAEFPDSAKSFKELCKSHSMTQYNAAVTVIFGSR